MKLIYYKSAARGHNFSQPAEFGHGFQNRFKLFNVGIHGMLLEVHVLSQFQDLWGNGFGYDHDPVGVGDNDVAGIHGYAVANYGLSLIHI